MKRLTFLGASLIALGTTSTANAQTENWVLTAINGESVEIGPNSFQLRMLDRGYGGFKCGLVSGDFAISDKHIVFRTGIRITSIRPSNGSSARAHNAARCDRAVELDTVVSRGDQLVLTGQFPVGSEAAADTYTFSQMPPLRGEFQ